MSDYLFFIRIQGNIRPINLTSGELWVSLLQVKIGSLIGQFAVLLSSSLSKVCHPPSLSGLKLDWNHQHTEQGTKLHSKLETKTKEYLERLLQLWQYKHKPSPCHFLLLHSSDLTVTHIVSLSPNHGGMQPSDITSVSLRRLQLSRVLWSQALIWFLSSMRWAEEEPGPGARMSSYGPSWWQDFSCILQDFSI